MKLHVGVDLHGTLLTDREILEPGSVQDVETALKSLAAKGVRILVCTGNDLPFLYRKIGLLLPHFSGAVLETGAVASPDLHTEEILVGRATVLAVKSLEEFLKNCRFRGVYKFARRLSTISMFTRPDISPRSLSREVMTRIVDHPATSSVRVTYSSVAVDIVPEGFSKWTGMRHFAGAEPVAAIADSMNDLEFLLEADYAFVPSNADSRLLDTLADSGKSIKNLENKYAALKSGIVYRSSGRATSAVSDILMRLIEIA